MEYETLIVTSKVKKYIKETGDLKCSGDVAEVISAKIRTMCADAIAAAKKDRRKTVKGRDFE